MLIWRPINQNEGEKDMPLHEEDEKRIRHVSILSGRVVPEGEFLLECHVS